MANNSALRSSKHPNIPLAPVAYSQQYQDQLNNVFRLYFVQLDNFTTGVTNTLAYPQTPGPPIPFFLTSVGDGTGAINLNQNHAGSATPVFFTVSTGVYYIYTVIVNVTGLSAFDYNGFGSITGGVTNGLTFSYTPSGGVAVPLLTATALKQNYQFFATASHVALTSFAATTATPPTTPQTIACSFNLFADNGVPLTLNPGDKFSCVLHDDFSSLLNLSIVIQGIRLS